MMQAQQNIVRREAERAMSQLALTRIGIVSSYDPDHYAAKVRIQPEDVETGWLPVATSWSGSGWGDYDPPSIGEVVEVHFQEGGKEAGYVGKRFFGDEYRPLSVPSGESWKVHQSGSLFKFRNDGTVELHAATALVTSAQIWSHTGPIIVDGFVRATGDIWDNCATQTYTMASFRATFDLHTHGNVQNGAGHTAMPDQTV